MEDLLLMEVIGLIEHVELMEHLELIKLKHIHLCLEPTYQVYT